MRPIALIAAFISLCQIFVGDAYAPPVRERVWVHVKTIHCFTLTKAGLPAFVDISIDYLHDGNNIIMRAQFRGFLTNLDPGWADILTTDGDSLMPHTPFVPEGQNLNLYATQPWPKPGETRWWGGWFGYDEPIARAYGSITIPRNSP